MTRAHSHQVDPDGIPKDDREGEQHPRQVRRLKVQQAEEVHPQERIPSAPNVHQHDGEGLPKEQEVDEEGEDHHEDGAEEEHHDEVGGFAPKTSLLQHPAVAVGEDHVEEKTEADGAEEQEGREEAPHLALQDERGVEIKLERRHQIQVNRQRCAEMKAGR